MVGVIERKEHKGGGDHEGGMALKHDLLYKDLVGQLERSWLSGPPSNEPSIHTPHTAHIINISTHTPPPHTTP